MREITCQQITDVIASLCIRAATFLPPDVAMGIELAAETEESDAGRRVLEDLMENYHYAADSGIPICQDTGMAVVFLEVGQEVHISGGLLEDAVHAGVRRGYTDGGLRKSVVADPLRRVNTEDNTPAVIHTRIVAGDRISVTVAPKGFGSENMSAMRLFLPSASPGDIEDFIVDTVSKAGSNPCPPVVVGVGLGGTIEQCALGAKKALSRSIDRPHPDPYYAAMEARVLEKINGLGIGPQGFGGRTTALAVRIAPYATHIAGLPCVVNMGCHASRHAAAVL